MNRLEDTNFNNGRLALSEETEIDTTTETTPDSDDEKPMGTLMLEGRSTHFVERNDLELLPVPESTRSFQPIPHNELVDCLEETLSFRMFKIKKSEFAVSSDGMKMFGLLEINAAMEGVRFAIGLRNSNDKSMRLGMVAGYRVIVCSNMMLAGDFNPLLAKHTRGFDLTDSMSVAVDRLHRGYKPLRESIEKKRLITINDDDARSLIYQAFLEENFPISLMRSVHENYFEPRFADFEERSLWSLENAFTESFKELQPMSQYQTTAKFGRFLKPLLEGENEDSILEASLINQNNSNSTKEEKVSSREVVEV